MTIGPVQLLVLGFDKPDFRARSSRNSNGFARTTRCA